jgi:hypothetical protein
MKKYGINNYFIILKISEYIPNNQSNINYNTNSYLNQPFTNNSNQYNVIHNRPLGGFGVFENQNCIPPNSNENNLYEVNNNLYQN